MPDITEATLLEARIDDIHDYYRRRQLTPSRLVDIYLARVARLDLDINAGPPFNCVVCICPTVREQATTITREIADGGVTKALHGIPVWIKDNIDVEGTPTTNGCLALADTVAARDADLVERLRAAGAIIMGKVGMTELGNGLFAYSTVSVRIGNAIDPRNPPGGSSSGAAVAVALNFGMLAVGVDDCASITIPAALNSCVGLRPTVGVVSRRGLFCYSTSDTSPGPIGRSVDDVATALTVLGGGAMAMDPPPGRVAIHPSAARVGILAGAGILDFAIPGSDPIGKAFADRIAQLQEAGVQIITGLRVGGLRLRRRSHLEAYNSLRAALRARPRAPRTPRQLYAHPMVAPHNRLGRRWGLDQLGLPIPNVWASIYRRTLEYNRRLFETCLAEAGCHVAITVTTIPVSMLATAAQIPHLTIPGGCAEAYPRLTELGFVEGSPVPWGISFLGRARADAEVLAIGRICESIWNGRRRPSPPASDREPDRCDIASFNEIKRSISRRGYTALRFDRMKHRYEQPTPEQFRAIVRGVIDA